MNSYRDLNRRLVTALNLGDGAYYCWARSSGVTGHTLSLLYALDDGVPHSQKQICEEWLIPKTSINTVVRACQEAGFVTLEAMPDQPRQRQICLTSAGRDYARQTLEELYTIEDQVMAETLEQFGPTFVPAMEYFTARLKSALEEKQSNHEEVNPNENPII